MAHEWYIDAGGRTEGPISGDELRSRAAGGLLRPADRVSTDRATWVLAETVPGLAFPAAGPPPARPPRPLVETVASANHLTDSSPRAGAFSPLDSVPGYELQGTLGTGACGVVYRAVQKKLNRVVALKTVLMAQNAAADVLVRFDQEAVSLARLQHPNIVAVYDCGHTDGRAYFAMELLDGEDLSKRLARDGPLDERTAWLIARQTAAALDHAARNGVIHRDVKPANLFLVPPPTGYPLPPGVPMVKVTDFGLALTQRGPDDSDVTQTAAGVILGTPIYMAPEQFRGGPVDVRADIYSLGATVHHVLTGRLPFDGRTVLDVMSRKNDPPPRLGPPVSAETAALVAAMMATDAADRPPDYADLIARIDALPCLDGAFSSAGLPVAKPPPVPVPAPAPRVTRGKYVVGFVALLVAAVAAAVALGPPRGGPQPEPEVPAKPATYASGRNTDLFNHSVLGWAAPPPLVIETGEEKQPVLTAKGPATRALSAYPNFRLFVSLSLYQAAEVDVVLATTGGPPMSATRWVVRLDPKAGAAFGKCVGGGGFERQGEVVPVQFVKEDQSPYRELRYERAGGVLSAWFDSQFLGSTPDAGLHATELRLETRGGPVRIESASEVELIEQR